MHSKVMERYLASSGDAQFANVMRETSEIVESGELRDLHNVLVVLHTALQAVMAKIRVNDDPESVDISGLKLGPLITLLSEIRKTAEAVNRIEQSLIFNPRDMRMFITSLLEAARALMTPTDYIVFLERIANNEIVLGNERSKKNILKTMDFYPVDATVIDEENDV